MCIKIFWNNYLQLAISANKRTHLKAWCNKWMCWWLGLGSVNTKFGRCWSQLECFCSDSIKSCLQSGCSLSHRSLSLCFQNRWPEPARVPTDPGFLSQTLGPPFKVPSTRNPLHTLHLRHAALPEVCFSLLFLLSSYLGSAAMRKAYRISIFIPPQNLRALCIGYSLTHSTIQERWGGGGTATP